MADLAPSSFPSAGPSYIEEKQASSSILSNPFSSISKLWNSNGDSLPFPGTNEAFGKEAKMAMASNFLFDGAKVELQKSISLAPMFQVNHSFALGGLSPGAAAPSPGNYNFAAVVVHENLRRLGDSVFMQASVEGTGGVFGVMKYDWSGKGGITKAQVQLPPMGSLQGIPPQYTIDHDLSGKSWAGSFSASNPSLLDGSGIFSFSGLKSVTQGLSLGGMAQFINMPSRPDIPAFSGTIRGKYANVLSPSLRSAGDSITTVELPITMGATSASYWQYLGDSVEAGAEISLAPDMDTPKGSLQASTNVGLKFDYRQATYRGQIGSDGKIAAHLEQRLNPMMVFTLCGEIDQWKNSSKFGISIQLEGTSAEDMNRMQELAQAKAQGLTL